ncbi:cupin domain-containing protein [Thermus antranikianii]
MESFKLHLLRLAREGRVEVPGVPVRGYTLVGEEEREDMAFYLVLEGELVIDLPQGQYLHLKRGEAARVTEPHRLVPVERAVLLEVG